MITPFEPTASDPLFDREERRQNTGDKREMRQERKIAQRTDRSKYRKSDLDAKAKQRLHQEAQALQKSRSAPGSQLLANQVVAMSDPAEPKLLCRGQVIEICAGSIFVAREGQVTGGEKASLDLCHIRGNLKADRSRTKNLVAVGDWVHYRAPISHRSADRALNESSLSPESITSTTIQKGSTGATQSGYIERIEPRRTVLCRADNLNRQKQQILATNVEKLVIVFALCQPELSLNLIDRYLIAARLGKLEPILVISKIDLLDDPTIALNLRKSEREKLEICLETYQKLKLPIISYRIDDPMTLQPLEEMLAGTTCVFSGPSGVGKSTLLSQLTGKYLRVQSVSARTGLGSHTTSHSQLIDLRNGGRCVDTPGIRSFGLWELELNQINDFFDEIAVLSAGCKFRNCKHRDEPDCCVREAVQKGEISAMRYDSYLNLVQEMTDKHLRR